jgi:hypothetical protein
MKIYIKKFHVQKIFLKPHRRNKFYFFLCVNDNQNVHIEYAQIMFYILCHNGPINASNPRTQV